MTFNPDDAFETAEDLQNAGRARHEKEILAALPKVQKLPDKTIYPLALAELAFTQTCQKKFAEATENLDKAEAEAISDTADIRVRILRGRGFILQESDALDQALAFYQQSYDLSQQHGLDYDAVEAANMMAHASHDVDEKIKWHKRAIAISEVTKDPHVSNPPAALYCALGRNYIEAGLYPEALTSFEQGKACGEPTRYAKGGIARCLRFFGDLEGALKIQLALVEEYNDLAQSGEWPMGTMVGVRGEAYEELAEIHQALAQKYAGLAYQDLSRDPRFVRQESERLEKMRQLQGE